jgi:hypothetical protein
MSLTWVRSIFRQTWSAFTRQANGRCCRTKPDRACPLHVEGLENLILPSFLPPATYPAGLSTSFVAVGDFNRDGIPDLAATNTNSNTVSVLLGTAMERSKPPRISRPGAGRPRWRWEISPGPASSTSL